MLKILSAFLLLSSIAGASGRAEDAERQRAFTAISPIFSQLVMFSLPVTFTTVFEQATEKQYIREAVPKGETAEQWTQMITVTGAKRLSADPQAFAAGIAGGFKNACPETFAVKPFGQMQISGQDAFAAVASCGRVDATADKHSETALIVAIKGAEDVYTLQWAVRTAASAENLTIDEAAWRQRLERLAPIRLCPIVPGEKAPYPSCVNGK